MKIVEPLFIALSTYSRIPVPQFTWTEENTKYALCWFPVVGVFCGVALWIWYLFCQSFQVHDFFFAAVATSIPILMTGGIHMDGFMDTVDALSSHQARERKLEILKDSHSGAFAVIFCNLYFLISFGVYCGLYRNEKIEAVGFLFVLSRGLSAICAVTQKNARGSGMLQSYTIHIHRKIAIFWLLMSVILSLFAMILCFPFEGIVAGYIAFGTVLYYISMTKKEFGGVTGDTSGFFLQTCELVCLISVYFISCLD